MVRSLDVESPHESLVETCKIYYVHTEMAKREAGEAEEKWRDPAPPPPHVAFDLAFADHSRHLRGMRCCIHTGSDPEIDWIRVPCP